MAKLALARALPYSSALHAVFTTGIREQGWKI